MGKLSRFHQNTDIGQNFLIDRSVVDFMVERAKLGPDDLVLEIGPGEGMLTKGLLASDCAGVCAIEIDARLKSFIEPLAASNKKLIPLWGDAVSFDYENGLPWTPDMVIANLPYNVTTPLVWTLLERLAPRGLKYMLLMVQLEAGRRITSREGSRDRSPLGVTAEALGEARIVRKVPASAFRPRPKVESCLVELTIDKNTCLPNDAAWRALLARSFAQRRKTLLNNWTAGYGGVTRGDAAEILDRSGLRPTARAEELPLETWFRLAREPKFLLGPKR